MPSKDDKIKELESKITNLQNLLYLEQNKNSVLSKENANLKQQISQLQFQLNSQNNFQNINNISNIQNNSNDILIKLINEKENIIKDLKEKIQRYPFVLEKNGKIMSIIFSSVNQKVNYSMVCKNTDTIHILEEKLYAEYPNLSERENYFLCKGKLLNKFVSFEKNNIKNGDIILLNQNDSSIFFH